MKDCIDLALLQKIKDQIDTLQAQVDSIEEESMMMKNIIRDLQLLIQIQVLLLKEVCDSSGQKWSDLQSQRLTELTLHSAEVFTQAIDAILG